MSYKIEFIENLVFIKKDFVFFNKYIRKNKILNTHAEHFYCFNQIDFLITSGFYSKVQIYKEFRRQLNNTKPDWNNFLHRTIYKYFLTKYPSITIKKLPIDQIINDPKVDSKYKKELFPYLL
jgi:hypothetical protein